MNRSFKLLGAATSVGVVMAFAVVSPAFAWHPKGVITKYVQNQSEKDQMSDANTTATALNAKPGDTLKYTIVIENTGAADSRGWNDMHFTKLTDTLPAGVELVSNPASRTITENIGVIKAGQKVTKEYTVKVTSTKNGDLIENKACFTGDSEVKDQPQQGCNVAIVKVNVPVTPVTPPTPEQPKPEVKGAGVETPATLPVTGPANIVAAASTVTVLGYVGNLLRLKRRAQ